jgi:xanthine dehydrogenase YagR molybdenum-binding subunit
MDNTIQPTGKKFADDRVDGVAKVTGRAKYTADQKVEGLVYAVFVTSTIAKGAIKNLVTAKAKNAPGVLEVIHHLNCIPVPGYKPYAKDPEKKGFEWWGHKVFNDNLVHHYGQPIALVVADTWERAVHGASLVKAEYITEAFETDFEKLRTDETKLKAKGNYKRGEADAWKNAEVISEGEYYIPIEVHNPIEMHATIAVWEGDEKLTVYDKSQGPKDTQEALANNFGLSEKNVRVITEYVGGAFGAALRSWPHVPAAVIAAKMVKRPVKLVLNRKQMFTTVGYRPASWQKISIGASKDGKLVGITHHAISNTSKTEDFTEGIVNASHYLYECPNVNTSYKILPLDVNTPTWMRGPGEASGAFALECALDDLAHKLNIDPVELRVINYAELHPVSKKPWSSKFLKECYEEGKKRVGWQNRSATPGALKENGMLVGYGMGGGVFGAWRGNATVKAILHQNGLLTLQSAVSDMGPGTITAMTKIASTVLQWPESKIKFQIGDSEYPSGPTQGGSATTSSLGGAVTAVCEELKKKIAELAIENINGFKGKTVDAVDIKGDSILLKSDPAVTASISGLLQQTGKNTIELIKESGGGKDFNKYAMNSFSAHFVKLLIDPKTGAIKFDKVVCTGDGGKIISPKTARSQLIGGAVGGIGMALTEEAIIDQKTGAFANANLGEYHVPLHTDVPDIETWFPDKPDPIINPMGSKGVGEIALIGFASAVTNAIFNATGKRIYKLPISPEMIIN